MGSCACVFGCFVSIPLAFLQIVRDIHLPCFHLHHTHRYGSKKKVDKALKEGLAELKIAASDGSGGADSTVATGDIKRVRMDIRHCYLPLLPGVVGASTTSAATTTSNKQPVVVIAKHLCGVATDLAIQSVRSFPHIPRADGAAKTGAIRC